MKAVSRKERQLTQGKTAEILNLSESMVNGLIGKTETAIQSLKEKQNGMFPDLQQAEQDLKQAEEMYQMLKKPYDELQAQIDEEDLTLRVLIGYKKNTNTRKQIRVLHSISNINQKTVVDARRCHKEQMRWREKGEEILKKEQRFMKVETLVQRICEANPEYKLRLQKYKSGFDAGLRQAGISISNDATREVRRGQRRYCIYRDKIGLSSWMDGEVPKPQYLKDFIGHVNSYEMQDEAIAV